MTRATQSNSPRARGNNKGKALSVADRGLSINPIKRPQAITHGLTEKQEAMCEALIMDGLSVEQAALKAGFAPTVARSTAYKMLQLPHVGARLEQLTRKLMGSAAPKAVVTLIKVMDDPAAQSQARVRAAEVLLDRAGFKPVERYEDVSKPGTMDAGTLRSRATELIEELRRREAAPAVVIDVTPGPEPSNHDGSRGDDEGRDT